MVAQYTHKSNFIYAHKKNTTFLVPIFIKPQMLKGISYIDFRPNFTIQVDSTGRHSTTPLSEA
jgi:hypothetical protein